MSESDTMATQNSGSVKSAKSPAKSLVTLDIKPWGKSSLIYSLIDLCSCANTGKLIAD